MVSVIVPVYNVEEYLDRCVESLLNQKYDDYEILLIDDGSTDNSGVLCDKIKEKNSIIHVYHKENGGLSSARNFGVVKANGEYVTFVDSDDYVSESYISDLIKLKDKFQADIAVTRVVLQTEHEAEQKRERLFDDFCIDGKEAFLEVYVRNKVGWSGCGKLFPKALIEKYPFPSGFYEEMASTYLYVTSCDKVAIGDYGNNYHYIRREGSITDRPLCENHYRIFEVCESIEKFVDENYPKEKYVPILLYQNAVLQLLTKLKMNNEDFCTIFNRYKTKFRKNLWLMIKTKDVMVKSKYYAVVLCFSPAFFKFQRRLFKLVSRERR